MKNILLLVLFSLSFVIAKTQTTVDFEEFDLGFVGYLNNAPDDFFESGNIRLPNNYTVFPNFEAWEGWAISAQGDSETPGFLNQYSVISGSGYNGSNNFALSYKFDDNVIYLDDAAMGAPVAGFYVNNSTYAYLSMQDGDSAAKKFGGESGDDEDYFLLTIKGYLNGSLKTESVDFYLADYRFADNSMDYIIDDWTYVDLLPLGNVDSLTFALSSSDNGDFGMNTPAYFCLDNFTTTDMPVATHERRLDWTLTMSPNPASDFIQLNWPSDASGKYQIYNLRGQVVKIGELNNGNNQLIINNLLAGSYILKYTDGSAWNVSRFVKL